MMEGKPDKYMNYMGIKYLEIWVIPHRRGLWGR